MAVSATYVGASGGLCARLVLTICAFTYHRALATNTSTQTVVRRRAAPSRIWRTLENQTARAANPEISNSLARRISTRGDAFSANVIIDYRSPFISTSPRKR